VTGQPQAISVEYLEDVVVRFVVLDDEGNRYRGVDE